MERILIPDYINVVTKELKISKPLVVQDLSGEHTNAEYYPPEDKVVYVRENDTNEAYFEIAHELRHKWQFVNFRDKYFKNYIEIQKTNLEDYGKQIAEIDANAFAVLMTMRYLDELVLLNGYPQDEKKLIFKRAREISKHFNLEKIDWTGIFKTVNV